MKKRMEELNEKLAIPKVGSGAKSTRDDLSKEDGDMTFSEKSRRIIYGLGNVELFELGQTAATAQCQFLFQAHDRGNIFFANVVVVFAQTKT